MENHGYYKLPVNSKRIQNWLIDSVLKRAFNGSTDTSNHFIE